jgi:hypothetical protein
LVVRLGSTFWILILGIFFTMASIAPFIDNLTDLIVKCYSFSYSTAGQLVMILFVFLTLFSIILGNILSANPHTRRSIYLFSTTLYFLSMIALYFLPSTSKPEVYHYVAVAIFLLVMSFNFATFNTCLTTSITYTVK